MATGALLLVIAALRRMPRLGNDRLRIGHRGAADHARRLVRPDDAQPDHPTHRCRRPNAAQPQHIATSTARRRQSGADADFLEANDSQHEDLHGGAKARRRARTM